MIKNLQWHNRSGAALIAVLVLLATVGVIMGVLTSQMLAQRRFLQQRHHQLQAYWLAQAGIEQAAAQLLTGNKDYKGETLELLPDSKVRITVTPAKGTEGVVHIASEAHLPLEGPGSVLRSASRTFRLVREGDKARLEPQQ